MIGDFDNEKFKYFSDNKKPKVTAAKWEELLKHYGFEISNESVMKYRQGKAKPRGAVIYAMSKILGVNYLDLLEGMEAPKKSEIDIVFNQLSNSDRGIILSMAKRMIND